MDGRCLLHELLRRPLHHGAVLGAKMFGDGGIAVVVPVAGMMRYDVVVIADLHVGSSIGQLHFLADVCVWYAVVVDILVKTRIAVFVDRRDNMFLHLVTDRIQRAERFLFHLLELTNEAGTEAACRLCPARRKKAEGQVTATGVVAAIKVLVVVLLKSRTDSYVKRPKVGAVKRFYNGEDVLIGQLDRVLHMRIILGTARAGGISRYPVMFAEPFEPTHEREHGSLLTMPSEKKENSVNSVLRIAS